MKRKIRVKRKMVKPSQLIGKTPDNPYAEGLPEVDEALAQLLADVLNGALPSHQRTVALSDLVVKEPAILAGARHVIREYPSVVEAMREARAMGAPWIVYRDENGNLVMFDDYTGYAAAELDQVRRVSVSILGETKPRGRRS